MNADDLGRPRTKTNQTLVANLSVFGQSLSVRLRLSVFIRVTEIVAPRLGF